MEKHATPQAKVAQQRDLACAPGWPQRGEWSRVLWQEHSCEDSHTDDTFLGSLVLNAQVTERSYWRVAFGSVVVTQQVSTVVSVVAVSLHIQQVLERWFEPSLEKQTTGLEEECLQGICDARPPPPFPDPQQILP